jgi:iron-sulfur cluster assembly protein
MIHLSQAAIGEIKRLRSKHNPNAYFRLGVESGGCSDFYYTLQFDQVTHTEDQIWNCESIQVVANPDSLAYIAGLTLDYSEDLVGGGFRFHNPNAAQHCGCGNSFSLKQNS